MESLRITHLFPRIAELSDRTRRRMIWISLVLLVTLAGIEAGLALMRDMLRADTAALRQSLSAVAPAAGDGLVENIPTAAQMILGFILPFALAFVAIPLESFIHSARTVSGVVLVNLIRALAFTLRVLGNLARHASRVLLHLYDLVVVVPLMIEHLVKSVRIRGAEEKAPPLDAPAPKSKSLLSGGRS